MSVELFKTNDDILSAILYENTRAFSAIINKDIYKVVGTAPHQNVTFHNGSCFELFCIYVFELLVEKIKLIDSEKKLSVFSGSEWAVSNYYCCDFDVSDFNEAYDKLNTWLEEKPVFSFYCSGLNKGISFAMSRRRALKFAQIFSKHNLFSTTLMIKELLDSCKKSGCSISEEDALHLIDPFLEELKDNRVTYHSSYLIELLYHYFESLLGVMKQIYDINPTNDMRKMMYPDRLTSDAFKMLYFESLRFASGYNKAYYKSLCPTTTKYLKGRF